MKGYHGSEFTVTEGETFLLEKNSVAVGSLPRGEFQRIARTHSKETWE